LAINARGGADVLAQSADELTMKAGGDHRKRALKVFRAM